jgi:predicted TIM-barrel fold metal-dependent hydrolase
MVVLSCDSHIGPRLREDLRPYCPARLVSAFDEYADAWEEQGRRRAEQPLPKGAAFFMGRNKRNAPATGAFDPQARLEYMDHEGIAGEVIFHGVGAMPIPFVPGGLDYDFDPVGTDLDLPAEGLKIYNRWLADACSIAPERLAGLAHLPMWDIELATREVEWAREAGLRGVNFPSPRPGIAEYDDPVWEPFWSACESLGMSLNTHAGAGASYRRGNFYSRPQAMALMQLEIGGWPSRRGVHWLVFGGVFERHPDLKLVVTEQNGDWWVNAMAEFDSIWLTSRPVLEHMPRRPSEYCHRNVLIGASFLANFEAKRAVEAGYTANVMWGSDFPHSDGTYQYPAFPGDDVSWTKLSLRNTFHDIAHADARKMLTDNAAAVYGFDLAALSAVAERIGALTVDELHTPIGELPEHCDQFTMGFRTVGAWA